MAYRRVRTSSASALGITAAEVAELVAKGKETLANLKTNLGPAAAIAAAIANDPALPAVLTRLGTIRTLAARSSSSSGGGSNSSGLGLSRLVRPLDAYIYTQRNPWAVPAGVAAVLAVPFLLGYALGRGR